MRRVLGVYPAHVHPTERSGRDEVASYRFRPGLEEMLRETREVISTLPD